MGICRRQARGVMLVVALVVGAGCATQWTASDQQLLDALKATNAANVQAALAQGARPNVEYADGMTPLAVAVARNDHASAEALLRGKADPNVAVTVDTSGPPQSLLSLAEDDAMAKILVKGGADPNRKDENGETPLGRAVLSGNVELVKVLLEVGASAESPLADGQRPLWFAVSTGNVAVVSALLAGGADPNREDAKGRTALHAAAANPSGAVVVLLLKAKAPVDSRDHEQTTPLMIAAQEGYVGPVRALLDGGADPNIRNSAGMTALDLANAKEQTSAAALLQESGAKTTRDATTARADMKTRERAASGADALRVFTTDLTTDGRNLKIRGRVTNPFNQQVVGVRYRVSIYQPGSRRLLDAFVEERRKTVIEPGGDGALRLDVATMYGANRFEFLVEAFPMQLGGREIPEPQHWR